MGETIQDGLETITRGNRTIVFNERDVVCDDGFSTVTNSTKGADFPREETSRIIRRATRKHAEEKRSFEDDLFLKVSSQREGEFKGRDVFVAVETSK